MIFNMIKLFQKNNSGEIKIYDFDYDLKCDYYDFIKEYINRGFRQVILTSNIMLKVIERFIVDLNFDIYRIDFMEDDDELEYNVNTIIKEAEKNRIEYFKLFDLLESVREESSIDIKKVYLKGKIESHTVDIFLQVNGIVGISKNENKSMIEKIKKYVERSL